MVDLETGEITIEDCSWKPFIVLRSARNYDMDAASRASGLFCTDETRAQQQFAEEVNINTIVERFGLTGELPNDLRMPLNLDFEEAVDYQDSLNKLLQAEDEFMKMPAKIREQFQNDPGRFVDFASDPKNVEQMREWGMAMPKTAEREPMRVRVVPEEAKEPPGGATSSKTAGG